MVLGEKMANNLQILVSGCSTVVEHMPHHLKVKGLSSTTSGANGNAKMAGRGECRFVLFAFNCKVSFYFILFNAKGSFPCSFLQRNLALRFRTYKLALDPTNAPALKRKSHAFSGANES